MNQVTVTVTKQLLPQSERTTTVVWAIKRGEPSHNEFLIYEHDGLTNIEILEQKCVEYAEKANIDRLRIWVTEFGTKPDFTKIFNK